MCIGGRKRCLSKIEVTSFRRKMSEISVTSLTCYGLEFLMTNMSAERKLAILDSVMSLNKRQK